jgi:hypothetical protein
MKKLPVGMQDFRHIIEGGFVYVDKTEYLWELLSHETSYFLSRPRRFGKTLTCSALYYLFKGEKALFKDTFIYDKWDFREYPVISISMTLVDSRTPETVEESLRGVLLSIYNDYGLTAESTSCKVLFSELIAKLYDKLGEVAILIDEYDRPILAHLNDPELAKANRSLMSEFYATVKGAEAKLRLVFLTGLTKITKAGVFSTLNHLTDITTSEKFATMLGYSKEELELYFENHIQRGMETLHVSREELIYTIKDYYDGFSFDGVHFVYNPFSILNFFKEYKLENYWINSGLPSSLAAYAKKHDLTPEKYLQSYLSNAELVAYEIEQAPPKSFLVQSGYLTFKSVDPYLGYQLDYPNREVKDSFSALTMINLYNFDDDEYHTLQREIIMALRQRDFAPVFAAMKRTLANIPGKLYENNQDYQKREAYYHTVILTLLWSCNLNVRAEEWTSRGISDLVLTYRDDVYIIELKIAPPKTSLAQIAKHGYGEKYAGAPYRAAVGIEIDAPNKTLKGYEIEESGKQSGMV